MNSFLKTQKLFVNRILNRSYLKTHLDDASTSEANETETQVLSGVEIINQNYASIRGIFVHIHKCAGTSLIASIEHQPEIIACVARPGDFPKRTGRDKIPDTLWHNCYKFTFVRNPYARVVSAFRMFRNSQIYSELFPTFPDFIEFLRWVDVHHHVVDDEISIEEYVKTIGNVIHHCSSYHNPKYMLDEMDYIGRLEHLSSDLDVLTHSLGVNLRFLPSLNRSRATYDYREYYSAKTRDIVFNLYQDDIERFDYRFGN